MEEEESEREVIGPSLVTEGTTAQDLHHIDLAISLWGSRAIISRVSNSRIMGVTNTTNEAVAEGEGAEAAAVEDLSTVR